MKRPSASRAYRSPDGVEWTLEVELPGTTSALVLFRHPDGRSARQDRYNWYQAQPDQIPGGGHRVRPADVLASLTDAQIAMLYRRSMRVSSADDPRGIPVSAPSA